MRWLKKIWITTDYLNISKFFSVLFNLIFIFLFSVIINHSFIIKGGNVNNLIYLPFLVFLFFLYKNKKNSFLIMLGLTYIMLLILEILFLLYLNNQKLISRLEYYNYNKQDFNNLELWSGYMGFLKKDIPFFSNIPNSEILFCNETGSWVTYKSDQFGFNNNNFLSNEKKTILLGDSFTEGMCVSRENNIATNLNRITNEKYLNLGISGTGPIEQLIIYREYSDLVDHDKVFWLFFEGNDVINFRDKLNDINFNSYFETSFNSKKILENENYEILKKRYLYNLIEKYDDFAGGMKSTLNVYLYKSDEFSEILSLSNSVNALSIYLRNLYNFYNSKFNEEYNLSSEILINNQIEFTKFLQIASKIFGDKELYLIYIPEYDSIGPLENPIKKKVLDLYKKSFRNIKFIDLEKNLDQYSRFDLFPNGLPAHFSKNGYKIVSEIIANEL